MEFLGPKSGVLGLAGGAVAHFGVKRCEFGVCPAVVVPKGPNLGFDEVLLAQKSGNLGFSDPFCCKKWKIGGFEVGFDPKKWQIWVFGVDCRGKWEILGLW